MRAFFITKKEVFEMQSVDEQIKIIGKGASEIINIDDLREKFFLCLCFY
jgi:hypothetical protein